MAALLGFQALWQGRQAKRHWLGAVWCALALVLVGETAIMGSGGRGCHHAGAVRNLLGAAMGLEPTKEAEGIMSHGTTGAAFKFLGLVLAFSIPFYAIGALAPQLRQWMPLGLPISVLMAFCPAGIALWLAYRDAGLAGMRQLLGRVFDAQRMSNKIWLLPSMSIMPLTLVLSYLVQRWMGQPLPEPLVSLLVVLLAFGVYFVGSVGEELGWMGYAIDPLQRRYGFWLASVGMGGVWWLWHVIPYHTLGRSPEWILWQGFATVIFRVVMVWIYNHAGRSVLTSILFHTTINVCIDAFPVSGSGYDPKVMGLVLMGLALPMIGLTGTQTRASGHSPGKVV